MTVFHKIRLWAKNKHIHYTANSKNQTVKLMEEIGELAQAILKDNKNNIKLEIGDCVVVLTILAQQYGLTIEECIESAYNKIEKRTGKTVNGVFVKSGDAE